ncbi:CHAT domain-containing protein [Humibacillus xanthopallidus]|uniref:CHAT domain-containing protein n=1 Tax=Humibacillus xanthopallidus TaxID=412689 RepID=A0A543PVY8_9MICO|nr:CHAT domain-containing protein [Humibacillus xanthopallidus]TQN48241.1 CHAT domain-containing protein [Humibacillus xanthopallidus]
MAVETGEWLDELRAVCAEVAAGRARVDDVDARAREVPADDLFVAANVLGAYDALLTLAGAVWDDADPDAGLAVLAIGGNIALLAQQVTGESAPVRTYARRLGRHGMQIAATNILRAAVEVGGPPLQGSPPLRPQLLNLLGDMLRELGDLRGAEEALVDGLADVPASESVGEQEGLRAALLNNLALVLQSRGDLTRAAELLREVVEIDHRLGVPAAELAVSVDNLGSVHREIADTRGPLWISDEFVNEATSSELGVADSYFEQAQALFRTALPDAAEDYAISLVNSAEIAVLRRDRESADSISAQAQRVDAEHALTRATSWLVRSMRGRVLADAGRHGDAIDLLRPWFDEIEGTAAAHEVPERALSVLLEAAAVAGDGELLERVARETLEIDDEMLDRALIGSSSRSARHQLRPVHHRTEAVVGACLPAASGGVLVDWLYDALLSRKGVLQERAGSAWVRGLAGSEVADEVRALRSELATLDLDGSEVRTVREARRRRVEAAERLDAAERALQRSVPGRAARRVHLAEVQATLDDATLLVDIVRERPPGPGSTAGYVAVLVRQHGPARFERLGTVDEVDDRLRRAALVHESRLPAGSGDLGAARRLTPVGREAEPAPPTFAGLTEGLLPLADHLERVSRVVVAPHGQWARVPLGLLPGVDGTPLIDSLEVSLVPSARWLVTGPAGPAERHPGQALVLGDADFDLGVSLVPGVRLEMRPTALPWTRAEAQEVGRVLGVAPRLGAEASRGALLTAVAPGILHVASHGTFIDAFASEREQREPRAQVIEARGDIVVTREPDEEEGMGWSPMGEAATSVDDPSARHRRRVQWLREVGPSEPSTRSALLLAGFTGWLAGAPTSPDIGTGVVTAAELALLDLEATELVVLSACETGVSAVDDVDGTVLGLRTAALAAGAGCCVASLWSVDDRVTAELMTTMYAAHADGHSWPAALRAAQLAVRGHHRDPFYWAAWVAEGGTRSAETPVPGVGGR